MDGLDWDGRSLGEMVWLWPEPVSYLVGWRRSWFVNTHDCFTVVHLVWHYDESNDFSEVTLYSLALLARRRSWIGPGIWRLLEST